MENNQSNKFKDLLDKLSSKGAAVGKSMSTMTEPEMPEQVLQDSVKEKSFSPSDIKEAQFGEVNKIKPAEFDYESKLAVLKKLIGG